VASAAAQVGAAFASQNSTGADSLSTVKAAIASRLAVTDAETCLQSAFDFTLATPAVSTCYGPEISYLNHPDGADGAACSAGAPCLDYGDVGIWLASSTTGEACSVEKANSTLKTGADTINFAMRTFASLLCAANALKLKVPSVGGDPIDLAVVINKVVTGSSLSAASIAQLQPRAGAISTWQTRFNGTIGGNTLKMTLVHSPLNSNNTTFAGHVFGVIGTAGSAAAFSYTYRQTSSQLDSVARFAVPSSSTVEPFNVDNVLDFNSPDLVGQMGHYAISRMDPTTGLGTTNLGWMDNLSETHSRVIQATIAPGLSSDVGIAYAGFGNSLTSTDPAMIKKMICNWNGPGAVRNGLVGKAQAQKLARNASGMLTPSQNAITYAPTNTCDYTPGTFEVSVSPDPTVPLTAVTNAFSAFDSATGVGGLGNIPLLSEPQY
jgi:hypothetical protein